MMTKELKEASITRNRFQEVKDVDVFPVLEPSMQQWLNIGLTMTLQLYVQSVVLIPFLVMLQKI